MKIIALNDGRFLIKIKETDTHGTNDSYSGDWVTIKSISDENISKVIRESALDEGSKEIMLKLRDVLVESTEGEIAKLKNQLKIANYNNYTWYRDIENLGKEIADKPYSNIEIAWSEITRLVKLQKIRDEEITKMVERAGMQGHNKQCYYCGKKTDNLAANPGQWAIPLTHRKEPGITKWHHTKCVSERLDKLEKLEAMNKDEK